MGKSHHIKRAWYPGATYHIINRGNHREAIFRQSEDYDQFLRFVQLAQINYSFTVHAYCLMTNHFHMLIETKDVEIGKIMKSILGKYATYYNHKYNLTGHLFQDRYTSCEVIDRSYFLEVTRYIHLNPYRAHMVQRPEDYKYSSYYTYIYGGVNITLSTEKTLRYLIVNENERTLSLDELRKRYHLFVDSAAYIPENTNELKIMEEIGAEEWAEI